MTAAPTQLYVKDRFSRKQYSNFDSDAAFLHWARQSTIEAALRDIMDQLDAAERPAIMSCSYTDEQGHDHWCSRDGNGRIVYSVKAPPENAMP